MGANKPWLFSVQHITQMQQFITQKKEEISALMQEIIDLDQEESHPSTRRNINDYNDYKINDCKKPPHHQL